MDIVIIITIDVFSIYDASFTSYFAFTYLMLYIKLLSIIQNRIAAIVYRQAMTASCKAKKTDIANGNGGSPIPYRRQI